MKNIKCILIGTSGRPSIKTLYRQLPKTIEVLEKIEDKELLKLHTNPKNFLEYKTFKKNGFVLSDSVVVRWGNRTPMNFLNCIIYNKSENTAKVSNKRIARELMQKEKIPIPLLVTPNNFKEEYLPIIGRPSYHSKCKNMRILKTKADFINLYNEKEKKGWYFSQFINKEHEYRVHCAHGKVLSISEKPKPKNHNNKNIVYGWGYAVVEEEWRVLHWSEYDKKMCKIALDTVKFFNLDFGAVDIMVKGKDFYVLEVNTACSLTDSPYLQKRYSMYFNWLFASKERKEHWKYDDFKAGKSFAWKNNQLILQ